MANSVHTALLLSQLNELSLLTRDTQEIRGRGLLLSLLDKYLLISLSVSQSLDHKHILNVNVLVVVTLDSDIACSSVTYYVYRKVTV